VPARQARSRPGPSLPTRDASKARDLVKRTLRHLQPAPANETSAIYCDDNSRRLPLLSADSVDLIYLDPPFFSNRQYEVIWGDEAEVRSFEDRWEGGMNHYIEWMRERVMELHRVLKPTGSLYLHCDPTASHYLKVMLDSVFGARNFRSEIVWKRTNVHNDSKDWSAVSDRLLYYVKDIGKPFTWNAIRMAHSEAYLASKYRNQDADGRRYMLDNMTSPNPRPNMMYEWKGHESPPMGWRYEKATMETLDAAGRIWYPDRKDKRPRLKRYLDEMPGTLLTNVWTDIDPINSQARERLGYPTQKPEALLERIVLASTNDDDVVLDPFCGCGTTVVVAERLKRRWIGIDISPTACNIMYRRLVKIRAAEIKLVNMPTTEDELLELKPFEFQNWIIDRINGIQAGRKSGDLGIDGWTFLIKDPVQIKQSESVGRNVVDNFETAIKRAKNKRGFVIAFSFTKGAREEVARVRREGLDIHLITVHDLLERPDWVMVQMGIASGLPQLSVAPMPQIDPRRRSADELVASDRASASAG
jgi:DNA modification methylase